jgi:hypothetical protein
VIEPPGKLDSTDAAVQRLDDTQQPRAGRGSRKAVDIEAFVQGLTVLKAGSAVQRRKVAVLCLLCNEGMKSLPVGQPLPWLQNDSLAVRPEFVRFELEQNRREIQVRSTLRDLGIASPLRRLITSFLSHGISPVVLTLVS